MSALTSILAFLLEHADLIGDIKEAVESGVTKDSLRKIIRESMVAASDAQMQLELGDK